MRRSLKNCQRVQLKSEKEVEFFRKREERYIKGTPKIAVGALQNLVLQVWTENLHKECLWQLKELNSGQKAFSYARTIVETCVALVPCYGYFIRNLEHDLCQRRKGSADLGSTLMFSSTKSKYTFLQLQKVKSQ